MKFLGAKACPRWSYSINITICCQLLFHPIFYTYILNMWKKFARSPDMVYYNCIIYRSNITKKTPRKTPN